MYGETALADAVATPITGLSPRVRGNPLPRKPPLNEQRSIPACTGKPGLPGPCRACRGVYPRVYGETMASRISSATLMGLSPRVRGNRPRLCEPVGPQRSIPACTGKPSFAFTIRWSTTVYPRVYGETTTAPIPEAWMEGLSPRVRGNLLAGREIGPCPRSIPACTGKPAGQSRGI